MLHTPSHGGRVVLEREQVDEHQAVYRVTCTTADGAWCGTGHVDLDSGHVTVVASGDSDDAPAWLRDTASAFLRTLWAAWQRNPDTAWPRKLHRWRPAR
jgi:hypothetical protein